ncbi:MAG: TIR domain-containing protein [Pseudomonadota bacterium]
MTQDVFFSYASTDAAVATEFCAALESEQISCWIAPRDVLPGEEYAQAIVEAIDSAKLVVLVLTVEATSSPHVSREIERAVSMSKPIITVRMRGVTLPPSLDYYLSQSQWLDADPANPQMQIPQLKDGVKRWLARMEPSRLADSSAQASTVKREPEFSESERTRRSTRTISKVTLATVLCIATVCGIALAVLLPRSDRESVVGTNDTIRLAVIPSLVAVPEDRIFLIRGVSEALTNYLSQVPDLAVIAGASSFAAASTGEGLRAIGDQLGATQIVEVSLREDDRGAELTVRLTDTDSLVTRLAASVRVTNGAIGEGLNGQVLAIARRIRGQLGIGQLALSTDVKNINPRAYESFLRALEARALVMSDNRSRARSMRYLKQATQLAPDFSDAWAHLSWSYVGSFGSPLSRDYERYARETESSLATALALDAENPMANAAAATWYSAARLDFESAERHLTIAKKLAPDSVYTQGAIAIFSGLTGDSESALLALENLLGLDPLNVTGRNMASIYRGSVGYFEEAFDFFESCYVDSCLAEGFVFMAASTATFTRDQQLRNTWGPRLTQFAAFIDGLSDNEVPPSARLVGPLAELWFGDSESPTAIAAIRAIVAQELIIEYLGFIGPTLARVLDEDRFFDSLELALEAGHLFYGAGAMAPLYGTNPYPAWVLEHPRYHALWERPGPRALAERLRANGQTAGLPTSALAEAE